MRIGIASIADGLINICTLGYKLGAGLKFQASFAYACWQRDNLIKDKEP